MKKIYQRNPSKKIIFLGLVIVIPIFVLCLSIYAGMNYYPFNFLPDNLVHDTTYFILIVSVIVFFIQVFSFLRFLVKLKKAINGNATAKESFTELERSMTKKSVYIGVFLMTLSLFLFLSMLYLIFTVDVIAIVIGRVIIGALIGMIIVLFPIILFIHNDTNFKTIKLICTNYLLDNDEIVELLGGQKNIEIESTSITYSSSNSGNPKDAEAIMVIYNKNDKSNTQLYVTLKLSMNIGENTWQVIEVNYENV